MLFHSNYLFVVVDKVFGPASLTEAVYEEGVKNVALSALMGINGKKITNSFLFSLKLDDSASMIIYCFMLQPPYLPMGKLVVVRHLQ